MKQIIADLYLEIIWLNSMIKNRRLSYKHIPDKKIVADLKWLNIKDIFRRYKIKFHIWWNWYALYLFLGIIVFFGILKIVSIFI